MLLQRCTSALVVEFPESGDPLEPVHRNRNVRTAVDAKHHMIVAHEVTNVGHDRSQLANVGKLAAQATGHPKLIALADRGYYEGYEILKCEDAGIAAVTQGR